MPRRLVTAAAFRHTDPRRRRRPEGVLQVCRRKPGFLLQPGPATDTAGGSGANGGLRGAAMAYVFADCELDCGRGALRRNGTEVHLEPQVFDVLVHLVRSRDPVVIKDVLLQVVWNGRIVSEDALTSRIRVVRRAIGDTGEDQNLIRTVQRRGFRFVGDVRERPADLGTVTTAEAPAPPTSDGVSRQAVTFVRTSDGVHLAVASVGS